VLAGLVVLAATTVTTAVGAGPTAAASTNPYAYVTAFADGDRCDLQKVDLVTGELIDLPAGPSSDACVSDLAVDADGTVYGTLVRDPIAPAATPALVTSNVEVVVFAPDGTPTTSAIRLPDSFDAALLPFASIAFDPTAGPLVQIPQQSTDPTCPSGAGSCLLAYDAATTVATPIGPTGLDTMPMAWLTSCDQGLVGIVVDRFQFHLAPVDRSTGAAVMGPPVPGPVNGMDCAVDGGALYAAVSLAVVGGGQEAVGIIDPLTGAFAPLVTVSDADAAFLALAVPPGQSSFPGAPAPTSTSTTPAAVAATVAPSFTG
jgi:hypothetical protein